jgi:acetyl esterase/lipase
MLFKETSLLLTAYALLGLLMCTLAGRAGARKSSLLATLLCVAIAVTSLVPVAQATKTSSAEGVPLSLTGYFADLAPVPERFADRSPESVPYARSGGEVLKADVWEPPGAKDPGRRSAPDIAAQERPAVIVVHGGGWRSGERSDFPSWDAWLADEGYVVFDIDYRLSPPPSWRDAPSDVACAVGWVKENAARYGVDPERIALMGRSAGGHLALLTAYEEGRAAATPGCLARDVRDTGVAAVVAFYPPTDLSRLSSMGYLGGMDRFLGGSRGTVPARYRHLSPVSHVDPADLPSLRGRRPDSSAGAVGAVCRAAAGGRRAPSPGGATLGQPHLRLSLGRMELADNPLLPRSIPGEQPQAPGGGSEDSRFVRAPV